MAYFEYNPRLTGLTLTRIPDDGTSALFRALVKPHNNYVDEIDKAADHPPLDVELSLTGIRGDFIDGASDPDLHPQKVDVFSELIVTVGEGGNIELPAAWQALIDPDFSGIVFDQRSGAIFVMDDRDALNKRIKKNLIAIANEGDVNGYKRCPVSLNPARYSRDVSVSRNGQIKINPEVFGSSIIDQSHVFDKPFQAVLKNYGSYFTISRTDGGWKIPRDKQERKMNIAVAVAIEALEATAHPSNRGQNRIGQPSGGVLGAPLLE